MEHNRILLSQNNPSFEESKKKSKDCGLRKDHHFEVIPLSVAIAASLLMIGTRDALAINWTDAWSGATFELNSVIVIDENNSKDNNSNIVFGKLSENPLRGTGNPGAYLKGDAKSAVLTVTVTGGNTYKGDMYTGRTHQKLSNEPRYRSPFIGDLTRGTF